MVRCSSVKVFVVKLQRHFVTDEDHHGQNVISIVPYRYVKANQLSSPSITVYILSLCMCAIITFCRQHAGFASVCVFQNHLECDDSVHRKLHTDKAHTHTRAQHSLA